MAVGLKKPSSALKQSVTSTTLSSAALEECALQLLKATNICSWLDLAPHPGTLPWLPTLVQPGAADAPWNTSATPLPMLAISLKQALPETGAEEAPPNTKLCSPHGSTTHTPADPQSCRFTAPRERDSGRAGQEVRGQTFHTTLPALSSRKPPVREPRAVCTLISLPFPEPRTALSPRLCGGKFWCGDTWRAVCLA